MSAMQKRIRNWPSAVGYFAQRTAAPLADSNRTTAREDACLTIRKESRLQAAIGHLPSAGSRYAQRSTAPATCAARGDTRPTLMRLIAICLLSFHFSTSAATSNATTNSVKEPPPRTTRELFNAGTRRLTEGNWREAEAYLQTALARQDERVRPPALYNLGHVRFSQGAEELKKSLASGPLTRRSRAAAERAQTASALASDALAGEDLKKMVQAYMNGRGARRELRDATQAVSRALELHGAALRKWQRSLGDFKSALELRPADTNAQHNVETVERAIARLVDSIREMEQSRKEMGQRERELGEQLKELRGRIPQDMLPPGADGDDELDEEGQPKIPPEGKEEGPGREGEEIRVSAELAGWLLDAFQLDNNRRLPMGSREATPAERNPQRNW